MEEIKNMENQGSNDSINRLPEELNAPRGEIISFAGITIPGKGSYKPIKIPGLLQGKSLFSYDE